MKPIKIFFTGGGTGGHSYTLLSIWNLCAAHWDKQSKPYSFRLIGGYKGFEKKMAEQKGMPYFAIFSGKLRRYLSLKNLSDIFLFLLGCCQSFFYLLVNRPTLIFSTGGYVSVPVVLAGFLLRIPVLAHEQTANVGLANKIASRFAKKIAVTFEASSHFFPKQKVVLTGNPVRKELFFGDAVKGRNELGFTDPNLPVIYVTGGAQGAQRINLLLAAIIPELVSKAYILHQCGPSTIQKEFSQLVALKESLPVEYRDRYRVAELIGDSLPDVFAMTSLVIGRSGAGTVNELLSLQIPALFIPLSIATKNEQEANARIMVEAGGAKVFNENELTSARLLTEILELIDHPSTLQRMKQSLAHQSIKDPEARILYFIESVL